MNILLNNTLRLFNELNQIERAFYKAVGMYCITCKPIVEKQLKDEDAVKKIGVDYMTDSVTVDYDSTMLSQEEIKDRLERSGYKFVRVAR
jgi:Cu+-exporting ATPase